MAVRLMKGLLASSLLIISFNLYSAACRNDMDCNEWEANNCECGVRATCLGVTTQNELGYCQCFGASGSCNDQTEIYIDHGYGGGRWSSPARRGATRARIR